jgi:hypothetical protein
MSSLRLHATGAVHPDEAWDRYLHPAKWSDWSPQIRGVETDAVRIDPGVTGRVVGPLGLRAPFVVDAVDDAAREWTWSVDIGPGTLVLVHWVRPGPEGGTTTGLRVSGPVLPVVGYVPLAAFALQRLVRP